MPDPTITTAATVTAVYLTTANVLAGAAVLCAAVVACAGGCVWAVKYATAAMKDRIDKLEGGLADALARCVAAEAHALECYKSRLSESTDQIRESVRAQLLTVRAVERIGEGLESTASAVRAVGATTEAMMAIRDHAKAVTQSAKHISGEHPASP